MPPKARVLVTGDAALDRRLAGLGFKAARKAVVGAMRDNLKRMAATARANAPADSGAFRRAIKVRAGRRSRTHVALAIVVGADQFPGRDYLYPAAVEFGTGATPAQAPLRRAFDADKAAVLAGAMRDMAAGVEKAATT
jgi:HK97 gp10 family phage protein